MILSMRMNRFYIFPDFEVLEVTTTATATATTT